MTRIWFKAALAGGLASMGAWGAAAGCSSSSGSNGAEPSADAATESSPTSPPDDAGVADVGAAAEGAPQGKMLIWNVVTARPGSDGGTTDGGEDGAADAGLGGDAAPSANIPLEGARVCVYQRPSIPCAMTAADGTFTMSGLPLMTDIVITVEKDGYRPMLRAVETASTNMDGTANPISMLSATAPDPPVPVTVDWQNKGQLILFAIAPEPDASSTYGGDIGATVALTPMSGSGPYFLRDDGGYDLSATSLVGTAGEYVNLDPGNYELTFTDTIHGCAPISTPFGEWGYPAPPTSAKFPVVAGYVTGPIGIFCTAK
jgi:hypothetical protein